MVKITVQLFGTWEEEPLRHIDRIFQELPLNPLNFRRAECLLPTSVTELTESLGISHWGDFWRYCAQSNLHYSENQGVIVCSQDFDRRVTLWGIKVYSNKIRMECEFIDVWDGDSPEEFNRQLTFAQKTTYGNCLHDTPRHAKLNWEMFPLKDFEAGTLRFESK